MTGEAVGSIPLPITWRGYVERRFPSPLELPLRAQGMAASIRPLPAVYQTDLPPDIMEQLPGEAGRYPMGPFLPRYAIALRRAGFDPTDPLADPGLDWSPPPPPLRPVLARVNRARHTNFRITVLDGVDTPVAPADDERTYWLVVNVGASDALVSYDKGPGDGIPLSSGGGFHELNNGTASSVRAQGDGGDTELVIVEGRQFPIDYAQLPC